jgi:hypothetical protein
MIENEMTKACVTAGVLDSGQCGKCTKPGTDPDAAWQYVKKGSCHYLCGQFFEGHFLVTA